MTKQRITCLCLALLLLLPMVLTGCGKEVGKTTAAFNAEYGFDRLSDGIVAENSNYTLTWDDTRQCVVLHDKVNNRYYGSVPYDYYSNNVALEESGADVTWNDDMCDLIRIVGIKKNEKTLQPSLDMEVSARFSADISTELIEGGGVRINYNFPNEEVSLSLELRLTEKGVEARIPMDSIKENEYLLHEIYVMPYFASAANDGKGYLMVPSGGGALIKAENLNEKKEYSESVYGGDRSEPVTMIKMSSQAYLPVFGATNGQQGVVAIIDGGAACARINAIAGDSKLGYSTAYASFRIRGEEEILYNSMGNQTLAAPTFSESIAGYEYLSVLYQPLQKDATYMGMANAYRDHLIAKGYLTNRPDSTPALSVNFMGSTQTTESFFGIPYESDTVTTSLEQTKNISAELQQLIGDDNLLITLFGYGQGGMASTKVGGGFKLNSNVGNKSDWNALMEFVKANNAVLAMDYDLVTFQSGSNGFSLSSSAAYTVSNLKAELYTYVWNTGVEAVTDNDGTTWYLLSRTKLAEAMEKAMASASDLELGAVSFGTLSNTAYSDYRDGKYTAKALMDLDVEALLKQCAEAGLKVVSTEANAYAAINSDYIIDTPTESSRYNIFSEDIPFYALVFQGYKGITSSSINTAINVEQAYLKAVSTGATLHFTLCDTLHDALRFENDTAYITGRYSDWKGEIAEMVEKSADLHDKVGNQAIVSYELANGLSKTVFENGVTVYVNYTDAAISSPIGTVPAMGFVYG